MDHDAFRPPGDTRHTDAPSPAPAAPPVTASATAVHTGTTTPPVPPSAGSPPEPATPRPHPATPDMTPRPPTPGPGDRFGAPPRSDRETPVVATPFPGAEDVDAVAVFRGPGYTSPLPPTNGLSTSALWLTVVGVFLPPVLVISALLGAMGLARAPRLHGVGARAGGAALAISLVLIGLWALIYVLILAH